MRQRQQRGSDVVDIGRGGDGVYRARIATGASALTG